MFYKRMLMLSGVMVMVMVTVELVGQRLEPESGAGLGFAKTQFFTKFVSKTYLSTTNIGIVQLKCLNCSETEILDLEQTSFLTTKKNNPISGS